MVTVTDPPPGTGSDSNATVYVLLAASPSPTSRLVGETVTPRVSSSSTVTATVLTMGPPRLPSVFHNDFLFYRVIVHKGLYPYLLWSVPVPRSPTIDICCKVQLGRHHGY